MAKLDPLAIMAFLFRMGPAILFIVFMIILFFSLRVEVHDDRMQRFVFELSDSVTSSPLAAHKSVFDPKNLSDIEKKDPEKNIELYSRGCEYGYFMDIQSLAGQTECANDDACRNFCGTVCNIEDSAISLGITGNCNCNLELVGNNFCQCKKFDEWQDGYRWGYGYRPSFKSSISNVHAEFPVGILIAEPEKTALPATLTITAYDSFLTRLTCITEKAYELKLQDKINFDTSQVPRNALYKRTEPGGTHVCLYYPNEPYDCRYLPDVPLLDFRVELPAYKDKGTITAYPIEVSFAACSDVKNDPSLIAESDDIVATVLLCAEARV